VGGCFIVFFCFFFFFFFLFFFFFFFFFFSFFFIIVFFVFIFSGLRKERTHSRRATLTAAESFILRRKKADFTTAQFDVLAPRLHVAMVLFFFCVALTSDQIR